jgi:hypothetical protein
MSDHSDGDDHIRGMFANFGANEVSALAAFVTGEVLLRLASS